MDNLPAQPAVLARRPSNLRRIIALKLAQSGLLATLIVASTPLQATAQDGPAFSIGVAPRIAVQPGVLVAFPIKVTPQGNLPTRSFVSVRGLPPSVLLTEGHAVGPGSWAVPTPALPALKMLTPPDLTGQSEVTITVIGLDGRLLGQAATMLLFQSAAAGGAAPKDAAPKLAKPAAAPTPPPAGVPAPAPKDIAAGKPPPVAAAPPPAAPPPAPAPIPRTPKDLSDPDRAQAERLLALGEAYLANGNIIAARDFFERAADAGLAAGALRLAATYDPAELGKLEVQGVAPDLALARKWYERARDLGAPEAAQRLARLRGNR